MTKLQAALDAYAATHPDTAACSTPEVRAIAEKRGNDLSWTVVACVMAALKAAGVNDLTEESR